MFKVFFSKNQIIREQRRTEKIRAEQKQAEVVNSITFVTLAEKGNIDEVTATEHTNLFTLWASGIQYIVGDLRQYKGELYRCIQAHTSQDDWTPDVSASLWSKVGNPQEEYPQWAQPIGAHDAYNLGDKVTYDGKKWVSVCDSNIWQPAIYGWELIEQ